MAKRQICESSDLIDKGDGVRFTVEYQGEQLPAFAVRYGAKAYAYLNKCAHREVELDWDEGKFFDGDQRYLICATHGALYEPATGACVHGPCQKQGLQPIKTEEHEGAVFIID